jgi:diguanylate cyclase (GGDEF)-like protein/PAS domain S-box-containing protein
MVTITAPVCATTLCAVGGEADSVLGLLFAHSPVPQFVSRADGSIVVANPAYAAFVGSTPDAVVGSVPADVTHADDVPELIRLGGQLLRREIDVIKVEVRVRAADGELHWCVATVSLAVDGDDEPLFVSHLEDISARKQAEAELQLSQSQFRLLADSLPVGVLQRDTTGRLVYVNQRWTEITGIAEADALGHDHLELVHPDDRDHLLEASLRLARDGGAYHEQFRVLRPDGGTRWVSSRAVWLPGPDGRPVGYVGSLEDVTERLTAQEEVERLAAIAEATSDLVGVIDHRGWVVYANRAARDVYGLDHLGARVHSTKLYAPASVERFFASVMPQLLAQGQWSGELEMFRKDGEVLRVWQTMAAHLGPDGALQHISAVGRDVTEQRRQHDALAHRATHDVLTGLPNRALLLDVLGEAVNRELSAGTSVAVLFIDLDRFKTVNDELGHDVGDDLLRTVAERFSSVLRPRDVVARLGGDEFVVLCPDLSTPEQGADVARRLLDALTSSPIEVRGRSIPITASVGVTVSSGGPDHHPEGLLREADAAMYRAKSLGRSRFELYDDALRADLTIAPAPPPPQAVTLSPPS